MYTKWKSATFTYIKQLATQLMHNIVCTLLLRVLSNPQSRLDNNVVIVTISSLSTDPTFTVENVTQAMEMVTVDKRRHLWDQVLRGRDVVEEIYSSHSSEEERLQYCSETYATSKLNSSWEHLVQKLYHHGELAAGKKAKTFLQQKGE